MITQPETESIDTETALSLHRATLVRLCAYLTGNPDIAEDLAQETLYAAWQHADTLRDQSRYPQWLAGIARNICRRWVRSNNRDQAHRVTSSDGSALPLPSEQIPAAFDFEIELERAELARLLDRALGLLPPATHAILIERYIAESSHADIAARLGMSEAAVKVRVQRGKVALRRVIVSQFPDDATAYGLIAAESEGWQETRIWCPTCGRGRFVGRFTHGTHDAEFVLRCPDCHDEPATVFTNGNHGDVDRLLKGIKGYKPALTRTATWAHIFYRAALSDDRVPCPNCGHHCHMFTDPQRHCAPWQDDPCRFRVMCVRCGWMTTQSFSGLVQALPESRQFWNAHPRMHTLPPRMITYAGRTALLTTLQSVTDHAALDIVSADDTYAVLGVHKSPGA
jgi:RNA polymerase sigma-70 factor (ECF subfamily)